MSMVISISRPRSVDLDLTVPLYEPEPVDSMCIVAVDAGEVHTMLASIEGRVLLVIVCVQFWFGRCCMKEFLSYFSFVMQVFVTIGAPPSFFTIPPISPRYARGIL